MRRLVSGLAIGLLAAIALAGPAVAATPSNTSFADVIANSKLVVYARIVDRADGGFTFHVFRVLKGSSPSVLVYPATNTAAPMAGWSRVVVAFADPATDDFRAPTIAWHVAANGAIDPKHYQRYPGLPLTLDAMLTYFRAPETATVVRADPPTPIGNAPLLGGIFLGAAWLVFRSRRFGPQGAK